VKITISIRSTLLVSWLTCNLNFHIIIEFNSDKHIHVNTVKTPYTVKCWIHRIEKSYLSKMRWISKFERGNNFTIRRNKWGAEEGEGECYWSWNFDSHHGCLRGLSSIRSWVKHPNTWMTRSISIEFFFVEKKCWNSNLNTFHSLNLLLTFSIITFWVQKVFCCSFSVLKWGSHFSVS
jgi:hypothetical protein